MHFQISTWASQQQKIAAERIVGPKARQGCFSVCQGFCQLYFKPQGARKNNNNNKEKSVG